MGKSVGRDLARMACALMATAGLAALAAPAAQARTADFTIEQVLSAPFPSSLVTAPHDGKAAWVFNNDGVRNVWVYEPGKGARAITSYTSTRMQLMLNADMHAGERGLEDALRRYSTPDHASIVTGMRERVKSGVYKLTGKLQNEDAIRMLVYNPVDTFRPCRVKKYENQWLW